jgi:hypothetical protein
MAGPEGTRARTAGTSNRAGTLVLALILPGLAIGLILLELAQNSGMQWTTAGAAIILLSAPPPRSWIGATVVLALVIWPVLDSPTPAGVCGALGLASMVTAGLRLPWADARAEAAALGALILVLSLTLWTVLRSGVGPRGPTLDALAYGWDAQLGNPAFAVGRAVAVHPWLYAAVREAYFLVPLFLAAPFALEPSRLRRLAFMGRIYAACLLGIGAYYLVPVCGPIYWASSFPELPAAPPALPLLLSPEYERNAVPSLHLTFALLAWWALPPGWRPLGMLWTAATVLSTLGLGEHYVVDLFVALPFAVGLQMLSERRWAAAAAGAGLTAVWFIGLRHSPPPTWVIAALAVASVANLFNVTTARPLPIQAEAAGRRP